ncbi:MAG TPA: hypothetical protein VGM31_18500, partial [Puia sp.]
MNPNFNDLIGKYLSGALSSRESAQLSNTLQNKEHLDELEQMILAELQQDRPEEEDDGRIKAAIFENLELEMTAHEENSSIVPLKSVNRRPWRLLAAASVFVILAAGLFLVFRYKSPDIPTLAAKSMPPKKIVPGSNKATLTLADGSEIQLDDSHKGNIAVQGGIKVIKLDNGILAYNGKN